MSDYYCNLCDKTIKLKHNKKHLNTKSHTALSMSIINRYCVKNPELIEIEEIVKRMSKVIIKGLNCSTMSAYGNYSLQILTFMLNLG